jgi:hypothetical protein
MTCIPMVARDDDCASAGTLALLDEVAFRKTLATVGGLELLCELVVTDTPGIDNRVKRETVLKKIVSISIVKIESRQTHCSTASRILRGSTSDVDRLVVPDNLVIAVRWLADRTTVPRRESYMGMCFSSARMASLAFKLYFSSRDSPLMTWMSRSGLPIQKSWYVWAAIMLGRRRCDGGRGREIELRSWSRRDLSHLAPCLRVPSTSLLLLHLFIFFHHSCLFQGNQIALSISEHNLTTNGTDFGHLKCCVSAVRGVGLGRRGARWLRSD